MSFMGCLPVRRVSRFDYTGFSHDPLAFLRDAVNYILGLDDGKNVTSTSRWR
jgi:hypothetical protein